MKLYKQALRKMLRIVQNKNTKTYNNNEKTLSEQERDKNGERENKKKTTHQELFMSESLGNLWMSAGRNYAKSLQQIHKNTQFK